MGRQCAHMRARRAARGRRRRGTPPHRRAATPRVRAPGHGSRSHTRRSASAPGRGGVRGGPRGDGARRCHRRPSPPKQPGAGPAGLALDPHHAPPAPDRPAGVTAGRRRLMAIAAAPDGGPASVGPPRTCAPDGVCPEIHSSSQTKRAPDPAAPPLAAPPRPRPHPRHTRGPRRAQSPAPHGATACVATQRPQEALPRTRHRAVELCAPRPRPVAPPAPARPPPARHASWRSARQREGLS
jgi:hypothetical protein